MKKFFFKDKTGRGITGEFSLAEIYTWDDEMDDSDNQLHDWATFADVGDEWEMRTMKLICIK